MSWVVQPQPAELRIGADHEPAGNETGLAAAFRVTREQERVGLARTGYGTGDLYDRVLAVERIEAAATAASLLFPFTLTARAECYLVGHPNPFLLIHESPLTDALFLLVSKSDEVTTT